MKPHLNKIIWFTGLSGAGKTTLAHFLANYLKKRKYKFLKVDGDIFRNKTSNVNSFSKQNIEKNNLKIIKFVKKKIKNYDFIIVAVISPLRNTRALAKRLFEGNYIEIFTKCSLKNLEKRDTKGLYKLAKEKKIKNLIGYNSIISYELSKYKKIVINTSKLNVRQSIKKIKTETKKKFNVEI